MRSIPSTGNRETFAGQSISAVIFHWVVGARRALALFAIGAASCAFVMLTIENNKAEAGNTTTLAASTKEKQKNSSKKTPAPNAEKKDKRELSKDQLAQYMQWAQQINSRSFQESGTGLDPAIPNSPLRGTLPSGVIPAGFGGNFP